jgi:hypothetical protein
MLSVDHISAGVEGSDIWNHKLVQRSCFQHTLVVACIVCALVIVFVRYRHGKDSLGGCKGRYVTADSYV